MLFSWDFLFGNILIYRKRDSIVQDNAVQSEPKTAPEIKVHSAFNKKKSWSLPGHPSPISASPHAVTPHPRGTLVTVETAALGQQHCWLWALQIPPAFRGCPFCPCVPSGPCQHMAPTSPWAPGTCGLLYHPLSSVTFADGEQERPCWSVMVPSVSQPVRWLFL